MKQITKHSVIKHINRVSLSLTAFLACFTTFLMASPLTAIDLETFKPVKPYFSPDNQINTNLLLLIDHQSKGSLFTHDTAKIDVFLIDNLSTEAQVDTKIEKISEDKKESEGLFAPTFFLTDKYLAEREKEQKKIEQELEQFGVVKGPKTYASLENLKKFNQTVAQDDLLDNLQKQLLIGLRGALFSYHFRLSDTDNQTLTTDEIITKRIVALPDSDRIGEYKRYLLALDAFKNNNYVEAKKLYETLVAAKHAWIAESANYMLIEIAVLQYQEAEAKKPVTQSEEKAKSIANHDTSHKAQTEIDTLASLHMVEEAVNSYQKLYPLGTYLYEAKRALFHIYQIHTDQQVKNQVYEKQAEFYEQLLQIPSEYEFALTLQRDIVQDLLLHYPFISTDSKTELTKAQKYEKQSAYPLLDFVDVLSLLSNLKTSGLTHKALLGRTAVVANNLEAMGFKSLGQYLRIEANWRVNQNSTKTLSEINALNLEMAQAKESEIFALYMIQADAYLQAKKQKEARLVWETLLNAPITSAQKAYLTLKLQSLIQS